MGDQEVKDGFLDYVIQKLPQFRYFCCFCSNASLRTGTLIVGWSGLVWGVTLSVVLTVMAMTKTDANMEAICEDLNCKDFDRMSIYYGLYTHLNSQERFHLWLMLNPSYFFFISAFVSITSITLLFGVYRSSLTLIRIWLAVNIPVWISAVDLYVINVIALLVVRSMKLLPALICLFFTNIGLGIYFYSIAIVKSHYLKEEHKAKTRTRTGVMACLKGCTGYIFQKIPKIKNPCRSTLRNDVLVVGWGSLILLFSMHLWTIFQIIKLSSRGGIDFSGFPHYVDEPDFIKLSWVLSFDKVISFTLLVMSVILLIGVYKEKFEVIKILILVYVTLWTASLAVYIAYYIFEPIFTCSRFGKSIAALLGTCFVFGFDFFCIIVIRSYYEEQIMQKITSKSSTEYEENAKQSTYESSSKIEEQNSS